MESLSRWFGKKFLPEHAAGSPPWGEVFTVIGSGGKTSLIWRLALSQRHRKVLVSPTTKMYPPPPEARWYDYYFSGREAAGFSPGKDPGRGISLAGVLNEGTDKLEALPLEVLEKIVPAYDLILLEGDGSRGLPLKGWADHEPVVPPYTSVSIGIISIVPLGKKLSERIVFRLSRFTRLSGAKEGETLSPSHLAAVIAGPAGTAGRGSGNNGARSLFSAARGKKLLFINQVEDEVRRKQARQLISCLPGDFRAGLAGIIAGSVEQDKMEVLD
ncbi:MAG: putative selenium-dependent hydroxylase accessory protein YqeC [Treponema sp.]|nr:putative selenium-dependent hydroxylase accessory protein YqeC [Treponema sp.]